MGKNSQTWWNLVHKRRELETEGELLSRQHKPGEVLFYATLFGLGIVALVLAYIKEEPAYLFLAGLGIGIGLACGIPKFRAMNALLDKEREIAREIKRVSRAIEEEEKEK